MELATSKELIGAQGLRASLERWIRPGMGFNRPGDVLKEQGLSLDEKREVLASWRSDASSVRERPHLRWLLGTPEPVPLAEIEEAMNRLDWCAGWLAQPIGDVCPRDQLGRR